MHGVWEEKSQRQRVSGESGRGHKERPSQEQQTKTLDQELAQKRTKAMRGKVKTTQMRTEAEKRRIEKLGSGLRRKI